MGRTAGASRGAARAAAALAPTCVVSRSRVSCSFCRNRISSLANNTLGWSAARAVSRADYSRVGADAAAVPPDRLAPRPRARRRLSKSRTPATAPAFTRARARPFHKKVHNNEPVLRRCAHSPRGWSSLAARPPAWAAAAAAAARARAVAARARQALPPAAVPTAAALRTRAPALSLSLSLSTSETHSTRGFPHTQLQKTRAFSTSSRGFKQRASYLKNPVRPFAL